MKIPCSNCNQRLEIPEELAGQTIDCPACNATLAVPALEAPPTATPQVQATIPQPIEPQKPAPKRKPAETPSVDSPKKSKSLIPKLAIAAVVAVLLVIALGVFFSSGVDIHQAAREGNIEAVKQAIAAGADVNAKTEDLRWWTPLHGAAVSGKNEIVELLIAEGVDVNVKDGDGRTPLHFASANGHKAAAELLIAKGADVNAKVVSGATQGLTPLDAANETNHPETADLLRKHGGKTAEELKAEGK